MTSHRRSFAPLAAVLLAACAADKSAAPPTGFLHGQIGIVVNSTGHALTLFQLAHPTTTEQVPFGASIAITPVGASIRGQSAIVPLGDAASIALVDLADTTITRYFIFPSGNATGSAFINDSTVLAANLIHSTVGRFTLGQHSDTIADTIAVAPAPGDVEVAGDRVMVVSGNTDENFVSIGNGIVTAINPATMAVLGTVSTSATNAVAGAVGPDGKFYVINAVDYVSPGTMDVIDPVTMTVLHTVPDIGIGPSGIHIDAAGLAYISDFTTGTVVYNTVTGTFVRGPSNPLCAPLTGGACRGAIDARTDASGNVYQVFFGTQTLPGQIFIYSSGSYALRDSVSAGTGPTSMSIVTF